MREAFRDVIKWNLADGRPLSTDPPKSVATVNYVYYDNLIREKFDELREAMSRDDLPEIADGIADLIYVLIATSIAHGIDLPAVWDAIQEANMKKFGPGFSRDPNTKKVKKPPGWKHPDIGAMLASQRPLAEIYQEGD